MSSEGRKIQNLWSEDRRSGTVWAGCVFQLLFPIYFILLALFYFTISKFEWQFCCTAAAGADLILGDGPGPVIDANDTNPSPTLFYKRTATRINMGYAGARICQAEFAATNSSRGYALGSFGNCTALTLEDVLQRGALRNYSYDFKGPVSSDHAASLFTYRGKFSKSSASQLQAISVANIILLAAVTSNIVWIFLALVFTFYFFSHPTFRWLVFYLTCIVSILTSLLYCLSYSQVYDAMNLSVGEWKFWFGNTMISKTSTRNPYAYAAIMGTFVQAIMLYYHFIYCMLPTDVLVTFGEFQLDVDAKLMALQNAVVRLLPKQENSKALRYASSAAKVPAATRNAPSKDSSDAEPTRGIDAEPTRGIDEGDVRGKEEEEEETRQGEGISTSFDRIGAAQHALHVVDSYGYTPELSCADALRHMATHCLKFHPEIMDQIILEARRLHDDLMSQPGSTDYRHLTFDHVLAIYAYTVEVKQARKEMGCPFSKEKPKFFVSATDEDIATYGLKGYGSQVYSSMNTCMRECAQCCNEDGMLPDHVSARLDPYRAYVHYLQTAIAEVPSVGRCIVYRGLNRMLQQHLIKPGSLLMWQSFSSSTASAEVALSFCGHDDSGRGKSGTLFVLLVESGRALGDLSAFPGEREVLLLPNSTFQVVQYIKFKADKSVPMASRFAMSSLLGPLEKHANDMDIVVLREMGHAYQGDETEMSWAIFLEKVMTILLLMPATPYFYWKWSKGTSRYDHTLLAWVSVQRGIASALCVYALALALIFGASLVSVGIAEDMIANKNETLYGDPHAALFQCEGDACYSLLRTRSSLAGLNSYTVLDTSARLGYTVMDNASYEIYSHSGRIKIYTPRAHRSDRPPVTILSLNPVTLCVAGSCGSMPYLFKYRRYKNDHLHNVLCRTAGFSTAVGRAVKRPARTWPYVMNDIVCPSRTNSLGDCSFSSHSNQSVYEGLQVSCSDPFPKWTNVGRTTGVSTSLKVCASYDARSPETGFTRFYKSEDIDRDIGSQFGCGYVCADNFDMTAAHAMCRLGGFEYALSWDVGPEREAVVPAILGASDYEMALTSDIQYLGFNLHNIRCPSWTPTTSESSFALSTHCNYTYGPGEAFEQTCQSNRTVRLTCSSSLPLPLVLKYELTPSGTVVCQGERCGHVCPYGNKQDGAASSNVKRIAELICASSGAQLVGTARIVTFMSTLTDYDYLWSDIDCPSSASEISQCTFTQGSSSVCEPVVSSYAQYTTENSYLAFNCSIPGARFLSPEQMSTTNVTALSYIPTPYSHPPARTRSIFDPPMVYNDSQLHFIDIGNGSRFRSYWDRVIANYQEHVDSLYVLSFFFLVLFGMIALCVIVILCKSCWQWNTVRMRRNKLKRTGVAANQQESNSNAASAPNAETSDVVPLGQEVELQG